MQTLGFPVKVKLLVWGTNVRERLVFHFEQLIKNQKAIPMTSGVICLFFFFFFLGRSALFRDFFSPILATRATAIWYVWQNPDEWADSLAATSGDSKTFILPPLFAVWSRFATCRAACWASNLPLNARTGMCPSDGNKGCSQKHILVLSAAVLYCHAALFLLGPRSLHYSHNKLWQYLVMTSRLG